MADAVGAPSGDLSESGIDTDATIYWNLDNITLIDLAVERNEGYLTSEGALVTETGERTGRSPNDKFIVDEPTTNHLADEQASLFVLYNPIFYTFITAHPKCIKIWDASTGALQSVFRDLT